MNRGKVTGSFGDPKVIKAIQTIAGQEGITRDEAKQRFERLFTEGQRRKLTDERRREILYGG